VIEEMYEAYTLEFLRVTGRVGMPLSFEPWDGAPPAVPAADSTFGFGLPVPGALPAS
jgi:hypothetical protein